MEVSAVVEALKGSEAVLQLALVGLVFYFLSFLFKKFILPVFSKTKDLGLAVRHHGEEAIKDYIGKYAHSTKADLSSENDNVFYEEALTEIEEDKKVKATWGKALAQSGGDEKKAIALYIQMRVEAISLGKKISQERAEKIYVESEKQKLQYLKDENEKNSKISIDYIEFESILFSVLKPKDVLKIIGIFILSIFVFVGIFGALTK